MGEFVLAAVEFVERRGRPAAVAVMLLGLVLVPTGLWLTFVMPGEAPPDASALLLHAEEGDRLMLPIMLVLSAAGLGLLGLGAGALFGTQGRIHGALQRSSAVAETHEEQAVDAAELPFWVCGECRVVRAGVSITARCTECASVASFVPVESERDRPTARSVLGRL